jgi:hypothetical protein
VLAPPLETMGPPLPFAAEPPDRREPTLEECIKSAGSPPSEAAGPTRHRALISPHSSNQS